MRYTIREAELEDVAELARLRWKFRIVEQVGRVRDGFLHRV